MDANFWHQRWGKNEISFHEGEANAMLVDKFQVLSLPKNSRVFVPLCGKTRDIAWLLSQGHRVVGVELSKVAIEQLFTDLGRSQKSPQLANCCIIVRRMSTSLWAMSLVCLVT
jgi:thiopurine S-methyltransferase